MSISEESLTKMSEYEMSQTYTQEEEMDDGQEEWLSEGLLTDDDGTTAMEQDHSDSVLGNTSQSSTSQDNTNPTTQETSTKIDHSTIEQELNSMDSAHKDDLADELDTFLIRKKDGSVLKSVAPLEESDGNDTDDLLRMLEDDDKTKKKVKTKVITKEKDTKKEESDASSDNEDDDFVYENMSVKKLRVAKNVLMRKQPASKAVPEDSTDAETDAESPDEEVPTKRILRARKTVNFAAKSTTKPPNASAAPKKIENPRTPSITPSRTPVRTPSRTLPKVINNTLPAPAKNPILLKAMSTSTTQNPKKLLLTIGSDMSVTTSSEVQRATSTPLRQYTNKKVLAQSPSNSPVVKTFDKPMVKPVAKPIEKVVNKPIIKQVLKPVTQPVKQSPKQFVKKVVILDDKKQPKQESQKNAKATMRIETDEILNEEGFLEEDDFDLDEDFGAESDSELDKRAVKLRIMKPEQFDEELLSDGDTLSFNDSMYDEFPASDTDDDVEDWFTLDIRSETAGVYLPLLGDKAYELLIEEKKRVTNRIETLKQSISSLTSNARTQANNIRIANAAIAEIEDKMKTC
ncbi:unnamed protein product [Diatraea saccharalis]|uniref:Uncharacterized protein n=1 Tax=Diatraea saccharalis TaxID=40085 RepID=A0A9N9WEM1_9NEOP|nr:unnamed protein product [Diatraea saccharalis]